ncbi:MAG: hypothetical protein HC880_10620 [Bacteroidia bacterium]|nr:hypothetical protein [Bacteroidia bacterium]
MENQRSFPTFRPKSTDAFPTKPKIFQAYEMAISLNPCWVSFIPSAGFSCQNQSTSDTSEIEEKSFMRLGGEEQYVEIRGSLPQNPVLLYIHGGPGWPQTPQLRYFSAELAEAFNLVIWEQRGSGQSYMKNPQATQINLAQIVADGHELTQILKKNSASPKFI